MEQQFLTQWPLIGQLSGRWMLCGFMLMQTMLNSLHAATMTETTQTCAAGEFSAKCPLDSVIVMTTARYGRMSLGKCVQEDLGYLGCHSDVISAMDIMCSGRTDCVVRVPDPLLESTKGCNPELKSYLEASYTCYNVIAPMNPCSDHTPIKLTKPEGYLSSAVASRTGCGFQMAPWKLEAKPGQQIQISFVEFNTSEAQLHNIGGTSPECRERAFLMDLPAGRKIKICPRHSRVSDAYVSVNNTLEVTLSSRSVMNDGNHFLIHYQFIGCPDHEATAGTRFHRKGTMTAIVSCIDSDQAFDLVCREGKWEGEIENCTVPGLVQQEDPSKKTTISGMLLIVLIAVSFILLCIIAAIFIFCVRRLRRNGSHFNHHRCNTHESVYMKNEYRQGGTLKQLHVEMEPCDYDMANRTMRYKEQPQGIIHNQITAGQECLLCGEQSRDQSTEDMLNVHHSGYMTTNNPRMMAHAKPCTAKESNIENEHRLRQQQLQQESSRPNTIYGYAKHKQIDNSCATMTAMPKTPQTPPNQSYDIDSSTLYPRNYASTQTAKKSREAVYVAPPCVDLLNNTL